MLSQSISNSTSSYYVVVSEWGTKTLVSVHATSVKAAEKIARQNAGKKDGWEGIHKVYNAFPVIGEKPYAPRPEFSHCSTVMTVTAH